MNPNPDKLEKAIHETLRSLPNRKAPPALEARVLAELARRAALPWWHRSWVNWPPAVRWFFLFFSAGVCASMIVGCVALLHRTPLGVMGRVLARPSGILAALTTAIHATLGVAGELLNLVPRVWLYGGVATITLLYATVFLAGAAAYRTLWQSR
jgi:hypothetical protein